MEISATFDADVEFASAEEREWATRPFSAARAREILHAIPAATLHELGFDAALSHPENMVLTALPVPPPVIRPSISSSDGSRVRGQDDLTTMLLAILKANQAVHRGGGGVDAARTTAAAAVCELQRQVTLFVHHDTTRGALVKGGAADTHARMRGQLRGLAARLKGKKGRIRGTLQGQRVNNSGRTVVGAAPTLDIHRLLVPEAMALKLHVKVIVTRVNMRELQARVNQGPSTVRGARFVTLPDASQIDLTVYDARKSGPLELLVGYVVDRFLQDDDWVVFNRQPSLHRMSMMAHQVTLHKLKTFGLSVGATTPYNCDFDGDEMNMHVFSDEASKAEMTEIMCVSRQIISPQSSKPIIQLVQDSVVAVYLLTAGGTRFSREQAMQLAMSIEYLPPGKSLLFEDGVSGKAMFSALIPRGVFLNERVRDGSDANEAHIQVQDGQLLKGRLCKKAVAALIHVIFNDCGHEAAGRFISDAQRLLVAYLLLRGFSVGVRDCVDAPGALPRVASVVAHTIQHVQRAAEDARPPGGGGGGGVSVEATVSRALQTVITRAGGVVQECIDRETNGFSIMVASGAKGSPINLAQILGVVGQQSVEGARIAASASSGRTLPCFAPGDKSPAARGFVANSYERGLTPQEYFFHAMGGCEGLVDTATKTANTGYLQRRLITMMMNLEAGYDKGVRNATSGMVVQRSYGGDGYDATCLERKQLPTLLLDDAQVLAWVSGDRELAGHIRACNSRLRAAWLLASNTELSTVVYMPFDVQRVCKRAAASGGDGGRSAAATPAAIRRALSRLCDEFVAASGEHATLCTRAFVRCWLTPQHVAEAGLTAAQLEAAVEEMCGKYHRALVASGEMVGAVGAASIGEPMTQLTLNSVAPEEKILLAFPTGSKVVAIGSWIDACLLHAPPHAIVHIPENRTQYLDIAHLAAWVPSVDGAGKSSWQRVLAVTRHLPVGNLVRVVTRSGRSVTATRQKSFLVWDGTAFQPTDGADVKVGDLLPTHFRLADPPLPLGGGGVPVNADMGVLMGAYLATTTTDDNVYVDMLRCMSLMARIRRALSHSAFASDSVFISSEKLMLDTGFAHTLKRLCGTGADKCVPAAVLTGPLPFARGLLDGYFAAAATAAATNELAMGIAQLAARFGMFVAVDAASGRLELAAAWPAQGDVVFDAVVSVEEVPAIPHVYDLTVEHTKKFALLGGLGMEDTFHYAGVGSKNVTLGVPRLKELIDVSANIKTPSLYVRFLPPLCTTEPHTLLLAQALEHSTLLRFTSASTVERSGAHPDAHMQRMDAALHGGGAASAWPAGWVARFVLDRGALLQRSMSVAHVGDAIKRFVGDDARVVRSEPCMTDWVIRVSLRDPEALLGGALDAADGGGKMARLELERVALREIHDALLDSTVQGVPGIRRAFVRLERYSAAAPTGGGVITRTRFVADTQGSELQQVMELPGVDPSATISNDIMEVYSLLGIEVAARVLHDELKTVLGFDGTYVNDRHSKLLVDAMTCYGTPLPVTRHGMHHMNVLARASFEETQEVLNAAAAFADSDPLRGVTESVLIGRLISAGTGTVCAIPKQLPTPPQLQVTPKTAGAQLVVAPLVRETRRPLAVSAAAVTVVVAPLPPRHGGGAAAPQAAAAPRWVGRTRRGSAAAPQQPWTYEPKTPPRRRMAAASFVYVPTSPLPN